jgi:membrane-associated protein
MAGALQWVLHLDDKLRHLVELYGGWTLAMLFVVVFCETGLVVAPLLPGDSLLFVAGALAGDGLLNVFLLIPVLILAAILGDSANYQVGHYLGPKVFREGRTSRFLKPDHLERTHAFFERYGGKTIVIARFLPIIRTFAPFVAGVGGMTYGRFVVFNVVGAIMWVTAVTLVGFWFGGLAVVKNNFELVVVAIIIISLLPAGFEFLRSRRLKAEV